ncbi:lipopolysaccharide biosynthesis protein [Haloplanus litoreus]|uniref:lipopolysaccharide biosynthesis protein n=1 Tax=Haloplanus litoreus TaxID=767515 RepID=UPI0036092CAE
MTDDSNDVAQVFRDLLKGGSVVFVGRIAELGISFLGLAVIARLIGPTDFGAVAIGSTLLSMLSTLSILGLDTGVGRFLPRYESPADRRGSSSPRSSSRCRSRLQPDSPSCSVPTSSQPGPSATHRSHPS